MLRWVSHGRGCALALPNPYRFRRCYDRLLRLQFRQVIVDISREPGGILPGSIMFLYDFAYTLCAAAALAHDRGLSSKQAIWERMLTRGQFVLRRFGSPAITLGVFADKLPSTRGLTKRQIDQDLTDRRGI